MSLPLMSFMQHIGRFVLLVLLFGAAPAWAQVADTLGSRPRAVEAEPYGALTPGMQDLVNRRADSTLTLAEAVQRATRTSPELRRGEAEVGARGLAVSAARAERLPAFSAEVRPSQSYGLSFDQTTGQLTNQTSEALNVGVSGQWTIYDGARRGSAVREARFNRDAATTDLARTRQQVAVSVAERYLQLLLDRELVRIQEEQLAAQRQQLEQVRILVEEGARPRADVAAQRSIVAERQGALAQARASVARDRARLVEVIGLDPRMEYRFVGPTLEALHNSGLLTTEVRPLDALLAEALTHRADLQAQALRVQAAEAAVGVARASGRPSVSAFGSVGTGYSSLQQRVANPGMPPPQVPVTLPDGTPVLVGGEPFSVPAGTGSPELERTPFFTQFADNRQGSIGVTFSIPIFDRFQARRRVAQAQIQTTEARIQLDALERQVASQVQQARIEVIAAAERYAVAGVQVGASEEAVSYERDRYELGAGTLYDLAQAEARLVEARGARAQATYELVFRQALLTFAAGEFDADRLPAWARDFSE